MVGVKSEFFGACLSVVDAENVVMKMCDGTRAIVFEDTTNPNKVALVMPMRIE